MTVRSAALINIFSVCCALSYGVAGVVSASAWSRNGVNGAGDGSCHSTALNIHLPSLVLMLFKRLLRCQGMFSLISMMISCAKESSSRLSANILLDSPQQSSLHVVMIRLY